MAAYFRALFTRTSFRLCLVLWSFGYALVEISATIQGRDTNLLMPLACVPLLALGIVLSLCLDGIARRGPQQPFLKWPTLAAGTMIAGMVQTASDFFWNKLLALTVFPSWQEWALHTNTSRLFVVLMLYTWTLALSLALVLASRSSDMAKLNEARATAFEMAASRAEAAALRLQLNPHFLFNTLNGIASLVVRKQGEEAEDMIGRLADFLRSSLAADPNALIPLRNELTTISAYLHIEQARLGDRLRLVTAIGEEVLEVPVPNFLLQPVIENAVKHGVAPYAKGGTIRLSAVRLDGSLVISVVNIQAERSRRERQADMDNRLRAGAGIGLANTRQRLHALYGHRAWVAANPREDGYSCEIGLPWPLAIPSMVAAE
jgi:two-component system LytT family sensor kinase